jgi:hypothetical protein
VRPDSRKPGASKGENESLAQRVRLSAQRPFLDQARVIGNDGSESRPRIRSGHRPGGDGLRLWIFAGAKIYADRKAGGGKRSAAGLEGRKTLVIEARMGRDAEHQWLDAQHN